MVLRGLGDRTVNESLAELHRRIREVLPGVERVAAAIYDPGTDLLSTFLHAPESDPVLSRYQVRLKDVPSLKELADRHERRVLPDLEALSSGAPAPHTRAILDAGFRSSYTVPFFENGSLGGFLFFDSRDQDYFGERELQRLAVFADLLAAMLLRGIERGGLLRSALHVVSAVSRFRDAETAGHLARVSRYARIMARAMPASPGFDDEFVEFLLLYTPVHDIGKIAIPESILFKPAALTPHELEAVRTHVTLGLDIVDGVLRELAVDDIPHVDMLRNIVRHHHELLDGSGYPDGLAGDRIPLEARIVCVADVFDALRSLRTYKEPWSVERVVEYLQQGSGSKYDPACVDALLSSLSSITEVSERFPDPHGAATSTGPAGPGEGASDAGAPERPR